MNKSHQIPTQAQKEIQARAELKARRIRSTMQAKKALHRQNQINFVGNILLLIVGIAVAIAFMAILPN